MPNINSRSVDARLRKLALLCGYRVRKSRAMLGINNQGGYRIVEPNLNYIVAGERFNLDADDVETLFAMQS